MDVDAFLVWADGRDGRWELRDGRPVMMAPERAIHALTKAAAYETLKAGVCRVRLDPPGLAADVEGFFAA